MDSQWRARYEKAIETARTASQVALHYFSTSLTVERKADQSPVTIADRQTEQVLRQTLLEAFPRDGFLGEESGELAGDSGFRWIIDPIDGTRNFVRGIPLWGTLVGLEYRGEQIAGVVEAPALGQTWRALRGDGAWRNDQPIRVSTIDKMDEAMVFYSSLSWFWKAGRQDAFLELTARTERQRGFGDFYGFVLVAQGSGELMVEYGVHSWDVAALKPLIEEAGGRFSDWEGGTSIDRPDVVVSNGKLHDAVLNLLQGRITGRD